MTEKSIERDQLLRLELEGMGRLGEALAYLGDKPVFVFGGIPGEEVEVEIIRERRHYIAAEVVKVIKPSPHRQQPPCRYFGECTGCQWQHVSYSHQLQMKRQTVEDALQRVGGLNDVPVSPTLPSPRQFGYRNHARFTVSREGGRLGYIHRERRRFIDVERCMLMNDSINDVLSQMDGHCGETTQVAVRSGARTGCRLIQPSLKGEDVPLETGQKTYVDSRTGHPLQGSLSVLLPGEHRTTGKHSWLGEGVAWAHGLRGVDRRLRGSRNVRRSAGSLRLQSNRH